MITREDLVEQSVTEYAKAALHARGYTDKQVEVSESFDGTLEEGLDRNLIALGFNFDDEGEQAELGSDLMRRQYTIQFFVFGLTNTFARNLANVLKFALATEPTIPLLDVEQAPPWPTIDALMVDGVNAERQIVPEPEPWQRFVWLTTVKVTDEYHARLV